MANTKQNPAKADSENAEQQEMITIERDQNFVRITADDIIIVNRPRDIQISLLAEGPEPISQTKEFRKDGGSIQEVDLQSGFTELARVGLPHGIAFNLAMNILEAALKSGRVKVPPFRKRFLAMISEYDESSSASSSTNSELSRES